jgi:hypothetical protein
MIYTKIAPTYPVVDPDVLYDSWPKGSCGVHTSHGVSELEDKNIKELKTEFQTLQVKLSTCAYVFFLHH